MNEHTMSERSRKVALFGPQDVPVAAATDGATFYSMANFFVGQLICIAVLSNGKTAVCQLLEATDAAGTGKAAVSGKTVTLTGDGSTPQIGVIDFLPEDLSLADGAYFVGGRMTTNQNGDDVCCVLARYLGRHAGDTTSQLPA